MEQNRKEVVGIIVTSTTLARILLSKNYRMLDVKPHRLDKNRSVFVFEPTQEVNQIVKEYADKKKNIKDK